MASPEPASYGSDGKSEKKHSRPGEPPRSPYFPHYESDSDGEPGNERENEDAVDESPDHMAKSSRRGLSTDESHGEYYYDSDERAIEDSNEKGSEDDEVMIRRRSTGTVQTLGGVNNCALRNERSILFLPVRAHSFAFSRIVIAAQSAALGGGLFSVWPC